ncbi:hypothetical protein [Streptomyces sp. NPDC015125]|uniref:hypothetical protein n=1 Tax=Streptomyces sp. NPDC015125 TaxID=3364938 RepID=UPI0036FC1060
MTTAPFSVALARTGHATVAFGPFCSRDFADRAAHTLGQLLRAESPSVEVVEDEEGLTHLPSLPLQPELLADMVDDRTAGLDPCIRLAAQVGATRARQIMAAAYGLAADRLWAAA